MLYSFPVLIISADLAFVDYTRALFHREGAEVFVAACQAEIWRLEDEGVESAVVVVDPLWEDENNGG